MKRDTWIALSYLCHHGDAEDWRAARDAIREARGSALLASALCHRETLPRTMATASRGRVFLFVGVQDTPRIIA